MLLLKFIAFSNYENYLSIYYPDAEYKTTVPKTFWRWRGIATDKNQVLQLNGILTVKNVREYSDTTIIPKFIRSDNYFEKFILYARYPAIQINDNQTSIFSTVYSDQSYRLTFEVKNDSIISKNISGFDLLDQ